jgi:hypothetical protein
MNEKMMVRRNDFADIIDAKYREKESKVKEYTEESIEIDDIDTR